MSAQVNTSQYSLADLVAIKTALEGFLKNKLAEDLVELLKAEIEVRKQIIKNTP